MQHLEQIRRLVRRVRWRLRLQTAAQRAVTGGALGLGGTALAVLLVKLHLLPAEALAPIAASAIALVALAFGSGLWRRVDEVDAAARLDAAGQLHDRLGSALAFAREAHPTPMQRAAIADAARFVHLAAPERAAPWRVPAHLGWLGGALLAFGGALAAWWQVGPADGRALRALQLPPLTERARAVLVPEDARRFEQAAEELAEALEVTGDARALGFLAELDALLEALREGRLSPREAHARLAALEAERKAWAEEVGEAWDEAAARAREAAERQRGQGKGAAGPMDEALEALRREAWQEAARALERLAQRVAAGAREPMGARERRALGRDLERLAQSLESERQRAQERLRREESRLKRKEAQQGRLSPQDRRRLEEGRRQLERLERERREQSEARRTLERLQREAQRAAEGLNRRGQEGTDAEAAEAMQRAAEQLRRMGEQRAAGQRMRAAEGRLAELREALRRAGQRGKEGDGQGGAMEEFQRLARGDRPGGRGGGAQGDGEGGQEGGSRSDGEGGAGQDPRALLMKGGQGGDLVLLGPGDAPVARRGARAGGDGEGDGGAGDQPGGSGVGSGHAARLFGEKTSTEVKTRDAFVAGREGAGPSERRVVFTAAQKGFATPAWREVHQDYSGVVEEDLDKQRIPPGQRQYVRRYFDLIRPR